MTHPDKRLNLYRPDLADIALQGRVSATRYADGKAMQVNRPTLSLRRQPSATSMQLTQALLGETLKVFDVAEGWAWVKLDRDGYVGHVEAQALTEDILVADVEVATPSTLIYPKPDLKTQPATIIPMLARLKVSGGEKDYAELASGGFVYKRHLRPVDTGMGDFVSVAERFLFAPYYWGGKTIHGLDCSGLVQLALQSVGHPCLRDSDMQELSLGEELPPGTKLQRGDLVFWEGHVGIMTDAENLLHANGFHMMVALEPLAAANARIGKPITRIRRI